MPLPRLDSDLHAVKSVLRDYFSKGAANYGNYRPSYPQALFTHLTTLAPSLECAWDCATGSGQAARVLAEHFATVIATDASAAQIERAQCHDRIKYAVATAERSALAPASIDLVTVAQALHWFDLDAFAVETMRVLKPGGAIAAWTYNLLSVIPAVDTVVKRLYHGPLRPFWPVERRHVESGYRDLALPFRQRSCPDFAMTTQWSVDHLLGYLSTWSALERCIADNGENPLEVIADELRLAWGATAVRTVSWPLSVRLWTI